MWIVVALCVTVAWLSKSEPGPEPEPEPEPRAKLERVLEWPQFEDSADAIRATQQQAITTAAQQLELILAQPIEDLSFDSTLVALDALAHAYSQDWDRMELLQGVSPDPEVRDAAREAAVAFERWYVENIELSEELYALIEALAKTEEAAQLDGEDRLLLDGTLDDFRRAGLMSSPEARVEIAKSWGRLAELSALIGGNISDAEGIVEFDQAELEGLSAEQLQTFEHDPISDRYRVRTALEPEIQLVMRHALRRQTRRRALEARLRRAMDENAEPIIEVLRLRARLAELLGYETWAAYRIEPYMAGSVEVAEGFIVDLGERIDETYRIEQIQFRDLAREELVDPTISVDDLGLEDVEYYANMLRERDYAIDEEVVKQYFAEADVLGHVFELYEELFSLDLVVEEPKHAWAEDVQVVMVSEAGTGRLLGAIYLDLHPRQGKYSHFATFEIVAGRRLSAQHYRAPITAIVGNFSAPVGDRPALWSLDEVETLLHELGHALHGVLTEASYFAQSGLQVPWDFVEVPSQTLERWIEDPLVLGRLAVHYQSGEPMPEDLIERIVASTRLGTGHAYARQVACSLVDFAVHGYDDQAQVPVTSEGIYGLSNAILSANYYEVPEDTAMLASFGHLYDGYDAGYYSYAWSDAIVADLLSVFRASEQGFVDATLGARLREEILAVGGSRPVDESIHAFLGRDWSLDALYEELAAAQSAFDSMR